MKNESLEERISRLEIAIAGIIVKLDEISTSQSLPSPLRLMSEKEMQIRNAEHAFKVGMLDSDGLRALLFEIERRFP